MQRSHITRSAGGAAGGEPIVFLGTYEYNLATTNPEDFNFDIGDAYPSRVIIGVSCQNNSGGGKNIEASILQGRIAGVPYIVRATRVDNDAGSSVISAAVPTGSGVQPIRIKDNSSGITGGFISFYSIDSNVWDMSSVVGLTQINPGASVTFTGLSTTALLFAAASSGENNTGRTLSGVTTDFTQVTTANGNPLTVHHGSLTPTLVTGPTVSYNSTDGSLALAAIAINPI